MNAKTITYALWSLVFLCPALAMAGDGGSSMLSFSSGIVTVDEFRGVTATSYMDIPYGYSTALFLTYRYFVTDYCAIGVAAGLEEVQGNLTEGNPNLNGGQEGDVGTYVRHTYTVAPEVLLRYGRRHKATFYGYLGAGYTLSRVEKAYSTQEYASGWQNGVNTYTTLPPYLSTVNPLYVNENHINAQVTPIGIRVGGKVAWNIEFGFGYKGLINTGLSVKL